MKARDLLRKAIEDNGLTVQQAASEMAVPYSTLSSALTGHRAISVALALRAQYTFCDINAHKILHLQLEEEIEALDV